MDDYDIFFMCFDCWEKMGDRIESSGFVENPFARCGLCGAVAEDVDMIEYYAAAESEG